MGRSYTPTYRVELDIPGFYVGGLTWAVKAYGVPTDENLEKLVDAWDEVGAREGIPMITRAYLVHQDSNTIVASYRAPAFKAV